MQTCTHYIKRELTQIKIIGIMTPIESSVGDAGPPGCAVGLAVGAVELAVGAVELAVGVVELAVDAV